MSLDSSPVTTAAAVAAAAVEAAVSSASPPPSRSPSSSPSPMLSGVSTPLSAAAMESVKRRGLQLSSEFKEFVSSMARKDSPDVSIPLELKLLAGLVVLFLFLLFLIAVLWDRYGKEIGELYTPATTAGGAGGDPHEVKPNDVADEYTVYQKLPTFFYEYVPRKKQQ